MFMQAIIQAQAPTLRLPPIARIASFATAHLSDSLHYLHALYRPQVRGSRRRRRGAPDADDDLQRVRSDPFERTYAIRWLTALIAQLETRQEQSPQTLDIHPPIGTDTDYLIQQAASLLAICSGVAAAGIVQRQFSFESALAGKIQVAVTDIPLDNHDYGSVGAQTWGGACVLAEMIVERPDRFGLPVGPAVARRAPSASTNSPDGDPSGRTWTRPLRILELGAGTGLVGLTVAKLLQALLVAKNPCLAFSSATIVLTDFYPPVLHNLQSNIDANFQTIVDNIDHMISISSCPLDWSSFSTTETIPNDLSTPFDVIFGADIVYEVQHAVWIRDCISSLLLHPGGSNEDPVFHLVIPLRPTHTFESSTIEDVFGSKNHALGGPRRGLCILSKDSIVCEAFEDGGSDDVEYVYYQIGWTR